MSSTFIEVSIAFGVPILLFVVMRIVIYIEWKRDCNKFGKQIARELWKQNR